MNDDSPGMTTREAAEYLRQKTGQRISVDLMHSMRAARCGPLAEKHGGRLVYRKGALDAFLAEFGRDPWGWVPSRSRDNIEALRDRGIHDPTIEGLMRDLDPTPDDLDPRDV